MDDLRLLTVQQPWAWAIVNGHKDVENRKWRFPLDLPCTIAVHAGAQRRAFQTAPFPIDMPDPDLLAYGAVIGFVDVVRDVDCAIHFGEGKRGCRSPWASRGMRHWALANPRALAVPIPARGHLWLHRPPPGVRAALEAEL